MPSSSFNVQFKSLDGLKSDELDLLVVTAWEVEAGSPLQISGIDSIENPQAIIDAASADEFLGQFGRTFYASKISPNIQRVLLVGIGEKDEILPYRLLKGLTRAIESNIKAKSLGTVGIVLPVESKLENQSLLLAALQSVHNWSYRSLETKSGPRAVERVVLYSNKTATQEEIRVATSIAASGSLARDLVNMPPNIKRTSHLAAAARAFESSGAEVEIVEDVDWIQREMPCFALVARGSLKSDPPRWIRVRYRGRSPRKRVALVGKSVIFDTGGYQVKPDQFMNTMKADMTGGATVLAVMQSILELKPDHLEVEAFLAATPNMIDANAMTPDSIVSTTCGKSVEIRHTDAEGRLTLIDAVTMAERTEPDFLVTIATLTGAATRAVGDRIALMGNDRQLRDSLESAAAVAADPVQTLDVVPEDFEDIKSKMDAADIKNTGNGKSRGAQTAAAFVMSGLLKSTPLVHLDIAGGDMSTDDKATGIAVRAVLQFLLAI